uniref:Uncharacterized protein n=1 Tax=Lepeophtheirus salmonis TaxID=72036 RepID=A0A0K2TN39_LEPSM
MKHFSPLSLSQSFTSFILTRRLHEKMTRKYERHIITIQVCGSKTEHSFKFCAMHIFVISLS